MDYDFINYNSFNSYSLQRKSYGYYLNEYNFEFWCLDCNDEIKRDIHDYLYHVRLYHWNKISQQGKMYCYGYYLSEYNFGFWCLDCNDEIKRDMHDYLYHVRTYHWNEAISCCPWCLKLFATKEGPFNDIDHLIDCFNLYSRVILNDYETYIQYLNSSENFIECCGKKDIPKRLTQHIYHKHAPHSCLWCLNLEQTSWSHMLKCLQEKEIECSKEKELEYCSICIEAFESENEIGSLKCGHIFHYHCIFTWVNIDDTCPNCRYDVDDNYIKRTYYQNINNE